MNYERLCSAPDDHEQKLCLGPKLRDLVQQTCDPDREESVLRGHLDGMFPAWTALELVVLTLGECAQRNCDCLESQTGHSQLGMIKDLLWHVFLAICLT